MNIKNAFSLLCFLLFLSLLPLQAQQTQLPLSLQKLKLYHKGIEIGIIDTVTANNVSESNAQYLHQAGYESVNIPHIYVLYADSIPKRKIKAALDKLFPWGTAYTLKKGPYQAKQLKEKTTVAVGNIHLVRAGQKRIAALVTGIAGAGIAASLIALNEPATGGVLGGITALVAVILEFASASDLIQAGREAQP